MRFVRVVTALLAMVVAVACVVSATNEPVVTLPAQVEHIAAP